MLIYSVFQITQKFCKLFLSPSFTLLVGVSISLSINARTLQDIEKTAQNEALKAKIERSEQVPDWRSPSQDSLVYMQLSSGLVVIELAPFIAPKQVRRFTDLVKEGFYDNTDFYRVIDGFVAQGGDMSESKESAHKSSLAPEFTRKIPDNSSFRLVQTPAFLAPETGYLHGFSAGRDPETQEEWLLHCPGVLAFARANAAQWVTPDFYITIGQSARHLDRNMTSLGRVLWGMEHVQKIARAPWNAEGGVIKEKSKRSPIIWIKMAEDVPEQQRIQVQIQHDYSQAATDRIRSARERDNPFFHFKGNGNVDLCYYQLKTRVID